MINSFKKFFFLIYLKIDRINNKYLHHIRFKFGQWIIRPLGFATYTINGCEFRLSPLNVIDRSLIAGEGHDNIVEEQIRLQLHDGDIFLDIGANFGYFSILASKVSAEIKVFAFEPSTKELLRMYQHLILNKCKNVFVFPIGLSEVSGSKTLFYGPDRNTGKNSVALDSNNGYTEAIFMVGADILPFDTLPNIKLCKIDVEGSELLVLQGLRPIFHLLSNCSFIVEISPNFLEKMGQQVDLIYDHFNEFGFTWKYGPSYTMQYDELFYKI